MSTAWFHFMRFWYLLFTFVTRPVCKKVERKLFSSKSHYVQTSAEYQTYRRMIDDSSGKQLPWQVFNTFTEWVDIVTAARVWEEDHFIWWNTVTDIEICNMVKYMDATWGIHFRLWFKHVINSIRQRFTGKYFPND